MIILRIENIYTEILGQLPHDQYKELEKKLSFRPEGYQFSPAYNALIRDSQGHVVRRKWDGWKHQCWKNSKRTYFPTGLCSLAAEYFKENKIEFKVLDTRIKPEKNINLEFAEGYAPRDYQLNRVILPCCEYSRGLITAATGSGKSICLAGIIQRLSVVPALFFVTSIDLLEQVKDELEKFLAQDGKPLQCGQIGGGIVNIRDVNVLTVQTAVRALGKTWDAKTKFDDDDTDDDTDIEKNKEDILNLLHNAKATFFDECITGDSLVFTRKDGYRRIDTLSEEIGTEILSYDENKNKSIWKSITHFYKKGKQKIIKITLSNGKKIRCTGNHLIRTLRGWTPAENINLSDSILCFIFNFIKYAKVKSIENSGEEKVFDITVEDTHCFFANGMLVHNCQHVRSETCQMIAKELKNAYYTFGASATPTRDSGDDMLIQACFGRKIGKITASELIKAGWLVKPTIKMIHVKQPKSLFKNFQSIYKEQVVENEYYNKLVANIAKMYIDNGRTVLVLVQQINHGKTLEKLIEGGVFLSGNSKKKIRKEYLNKLRRKEISCIISTVIFDEGIDCRPLDTVILCGGGKSKVRAMQRIGRILRPYEDEFGKKETATAIDFIIHQKYLDKHAKERLKMYKTEPEFVIEEIDN